MDKNFYRQKVKELILSQKEKENSDLMIYKNLLSQSFLKSVKSVFCYVSVDDEVDTHTLICYLLENNIKVAVPVCTGKSEMIARYITSFDDLVKGKYGILEPKDTCEMARDFDIAIVPCVASSKNCKRLGHGAGYYDRYMENSSYKKICLCREKLIFDDLPTTKYDIVMDFIVSENNIYHI